jgi:flagellar biosynthesis protein FlhF
MRLKVYRASGMGEAMARIRAELGADALILSSRKVAGGVEVTAALEPAEPVPVAPATPLPSPDPRRAEALAWHGVPEAVARRLRAGPLSFALSAALKFGRLDLRPHAPPLLFVGPPGAGKTLTVARLATRLVMAGVEPLVVTADGQRAGAAEQLAAFTRLLRLELLVASTPATLAHALAGRRDGAPVLIDAPGSDAFHPTQRNSLVELARTVGATAALVLPAGLDAAEAADIAQAHREAGATLLVATRLDLARRLGSVLAAAAGLVCAEAGIGPGAADGLVPLTPDLLATRLMQTPAHAEPLHA